MKKQYIVQKYVMAESVEEAVRKSKKLPIHEVYVHALWLERNTNNNFFLQEMNKIGLHES